MDLRHCDKPGLRIVRASVFKGEGRIPIDPGDIREIKAAFGKSLVSLLVIPFKLHGDLYTHIKWPINKCVYENATGSRGERLLGSSRIERLLFLNSPATRGILDS